MAHVNLVPGHRTDPDSLLSKLLLIDHAASCFGGARVRGVWPRLNVSTIPIVPPQLGHGWRSVRGGNFLFFRLIRLRSRVWFCVQLGSDTGNVCLSARHRRQIHNVEYGGNRLVERGPGNGG